jgi:HAD superfamily hydrolase (TIGR01509 family)
MSPHVFLFDLDGTLLLDQHSPIEQFISYCARLGHSLNGDTPARLERWQLEYWSHHDEVEAQISVEGREQFWINYNIHQLKFLNIDGPLDEYAIKIDGWFRTEYVYKPFIAPDVRPTLTHLRDSGATVGLVSNRSTPLEAVTQEHGLADLFHFTLSAGEAKAYKPKPDIFHKALQMAGASPESAVYVGDNYYADIVGSRKAGLTPILIDRRDIFPEADCRKIKAIAELI